MILNSQIGLMFYNAIGIMSGTSLDGLDIVHCKFIKTQDKWSYELLAAQTITFPKQLANRLAKARELGGLELIELDLSLGSFIGNRINDFLRSEEIKSEEINFIASHGHTIFHQPQRRITYQIGNGQEIARVTGLPIVCDFRKKDVLYGGQGAPLVPIGDRDLFSTIFNTEAMLNLGGFANITHIHREQIEAFDIGPCNLVLNRYARVLGQTFDRGGDLGRIAKIKLPHLVQTLNDLAYFHQDSPKSLGVEWLDGHFYKLLDIDELSAQDKLGICYEVISDQIATVLDNRTIKKALVTGGGAKNDYLIELIREKCNTEIVVPDPKTIDYKEAIVFAYLGVLFFEKQPNCLKEVTAASESVCGGVLYKP